MCFGDTLSELSEFGAAFRHLRDGNGKEALRMMFPAFKTTSRVLFPGIDRFIKPVLDQRYAANRPALDADRLLLAA
jgi:hypothetical protein